MTGVVIGVAGVVAAGLVRSVVAMSRVGTGHPLKHRLLDLAARGVQPKYPLQAMSTYLNGLHLYADEVGRQVEASHFCIHLRDDLHSASSSTATRWTPD